MPIRNVVFDFGHVIINWRPYLALTDLFASEAEMDRIFIEIGFHSWNLRLDGGWDLDEGLDAVRREQPDHAHIFEMYLDRIELAHSQTVPGTCDLIERLHSGGIPLFGLTNANVKGVAATRAQTPQINLMKDVVVSAEVKMMKPEPGIFQVLLDRNGLTPGETLFIDDSAANCEAANALGLQIHHFRSADTLAIELTQLGLI